MAVEDGPNTSGLDPIEEEGLLLWSNAHNVGPDARNREIYNGTAKAAQEMIGAYRKAGKARLIRAQVGRLIEHARQEALGTPEKTMLTVATGIALGTFLADLLTARHKNSQSQQRRPNP